MVDGVEIEPGELAWSSALAEVDGQNRRPGLWAKAFAESMGNENVAKAIYLRERAQQLASESASPGGQTAATHDASTSKAALRPIEESNYRGRSLQPKVQTDWERARLQDAPQLEKDESTDLGSIIETRPISRIGFLHGAIDILPALQCALLFVGIGLAIAIPLISERGPWALFLLISSAILAAVFVVVVLRPKRAEGNITIAWKRFLARMIDLSLTTCLGAGIVVALVDPATPMGALLAFWLITLVAWFVLEALASYHRGRTLGKAILGLSLEPIPGRRLPETLDRSIYVLAYGLALGIPAALGFAATIQYKRFRETGTTSWDQGRFTVSSVPVGAGMMVVALLILGFLSVLSSAISIAIWKDLNAKNAKAAMMTRPSNEIPPPAQAAQPSREADVYLIVASAYPNWREIVNSREFRSWLETISSTDARKIRETWDPDVAKDAIARFLKTQPGKRFVLPGRAPTLEEFLAKAKTEFPRKSRSEVVELFQRVYGDGSR